LCKLSAKTLPEEDPKSKLTIPFTITTVVDHLALNSKVLSLELILAVFENCGEAFRHCDKFIYAAQNYLCVSLLKNCMSVHTDVAYLSLKLFIVLVSSSLVSLRFLRLLLFISFGSQIFPSFNLIVPTSFADVQFQDTSKV
jgi:brefeldin A-inhibited guanine nucleotide-exchange protein